MSRNQSSKYLEKHINQLNIRNLRLFNYLHKSFTNAKYLVTVLASLVLGDARLPFNSCPTRVFYIFTIITRGTRSFSTLKMTLTYLALL